MTANPEPAEVVCKDCSEVKSNWRHDADMFSLECHSFNPAEPPIEGVDLRVVELEAALRLIVERVEPLGEDCDPVALAEIAELALLHSSEETVTISLGLDAHDAWSVIPKERQAAIIEDLRGYARRRIEVEVVSHYTISPPPPPDFPTLSETIEQHKGPWFDGVEQHQND